jgi:glycerol-3-phosphate O-acyltransferase
LLSAKKHAMAETELELAIEHNLQLLRTAPYSQLATLPDVSAKELLASTLKLNRFTVSEDSFGKIISLSHKNAVALTYYRNNILHLFALPGLICAIVFAHKGLETSKILALISKLYPLLQKELFIYMSPEQAVEYAQTLINNMEDMGLLCQQGQKILLPETTSKAFYSSWLLNRTIQETLHRYAVVLTLLEREKEMSRGALEKKSRLFAERLAALHGISSPEFFDKNVLATFINALKENDLLAISEGGQLKHSAQSEALRLDVLALISPEIAQRLQQI